MRALLVKQVISLWTKTGVYTGNCSGAHLEKVRPTILIPLSHLNPQHRLNQTSHSKGQHAENACCEYLKQQGLKLLARNYRGHRGEIDLVMQEAQTLVFVEVRFRKNSFYGSALESVDQKKQLRILSTAEEYLQNKTKLKNGRIDVVAMSQKPQNKPNDDTEDNYTFEWIKNAF